MGDVRPGCGAAGGSRQVSEGRGVNRSNKVELKERWGRTGGGGGASRLHCPTCLERTLAGIQSRRKEALRLDR